MAILSLLIMILCRKEYDSPCGRLVLGSLGNKLALCDWADRRDGNRIFSRICRILKTELREGDSAAIDNAVLQLDEYFAGTRRTFNIPLIMAGTDFQKKVWSYLCEIPYGVSVSYKSVAYGIGRKNAVRAVANAIGANALSIFIPCHRVVGSDGSLAGFAGGLQAKSFLLDYEKSCMMPVNNRDVDIRKDSMSL